MPDFKGVLLLWVQEEEEEEKKNSEKETIGMSDQKDKSKQK